MKDFKTFGIKPTTQALIGEKIKIDRVLNKQIIVHKFRIEESKFKEKGNGKCLYIQIETDSQQRVLFTGSVSLMDMISKVSDADFPFVTTIQKDNDRFEFT